MVKKISMSININLVAGELELDHPLIPLVESYGINPQYFVDQFNQLTLELKGYKVKTRIIIYPNRTFNIMAK